MNKSKNESKNQSKNQPENQPKNKNTYKSSPKLFNYRTWGPKTWKFQGRKAVIEDKEKKLKELENELMSENIINSNKLKELIKNKDLNSEFKNLKLTRILKQPSQNSNILKIIRNKKEAYNLEKKNLNTAKSEYIKAKEITKNERSLPFLKTTAEEKTRYEFQKAILNKNLNTKLKNSLKNSLKNLNSYKSRYYKTASVKGKKQFNNAVKKVTPLVFEKIYNEEKKSKNKSNTNKSNTNKSNTNKSNLNENKYKNLRNNAFKNGKSGKNVENGLKNLFSFEAYKLFKKKKTNWSKNLNNEQKAYFNTLKNKLLTKNDFMKKYKEHIINTNAKEKVAEEAERQRLAAEEAAKKAQANAAQTQSQSNAQLDQLTNAQLGLLNIAELTNVKLAKLTNLNNTQLAKLTNDQLAILTIKAQNFSQRAKDAAKASGSTASATTANKANSFFKRVQKIAAEAERQRLAKEEAERQRLAAEAERQRLAKEEAERQRLAAEAERQRLAAAKAPATQSGKQTKKYMYQSIKSKNFKLNNSEKKIKEIFEKSENFNEDLLKCLLIISRRMVDENYNIINSFNYINKLYESLLTIGIGGIDDLSYLDYVLFIYDDFIRNTGINFNNLTEENKEYFKNYFYENFTEKKKKKKNNYSNVYYFYVYIIDIYYNTNLKFNEGNEKKPYFIPNTLKDYYAGLYNEFLKKNIISKGFKERFIKFFNEQQLNLNSLKELQTKQNNRFKAAFNSVKKKPGKVKSKGNATTAALPVKNANATPPGNAAANITVATKSLEKNNPNNIANVIINHFKNKKKNNQVINFPTNYTKENIENLIKTIKNENKKKTLRNILNNFYSVETIIPFSE